MALPFDNSRRLIGANLFFATTGAVLELDRDPHSLFRRMRLMTPFLRRDDGSYIAIRSGDVERLYGDTRTRQMQTERLRSQGITHGYLHDNAVGIYQGKVH